MRLIIPNPKLHVLIFQDKILKNLTLASGPVAWRRAVASPPYSGPLSQDNNALSLRG